MTRKITDAEKIDLLINAGRLYHDALDQAFAALIVCTRATKREAIEPFFPSRSPMWGKMIRAKLMVDTVEAMQRTKQ